MVASEPQQSVFHGEGSRQAISLTFPRSETLDESGLLLAVFTSEGQVSPGTYTAQSYTEWVIERLGIPSTQKPEAESLSLKYLNDRANKYVYMMLGTSGQWKLFMIAAGQATEKVTKYGLLP